MKGNIEDLDLAMLFPGEDVQIGNAILTIEPMKIRDLMNAIRMGKDSMAEMAEQGITLQNCFSEKLPETLDFLITDGIDILAAASGISRDLVEKLPAGKTIEIAEKTIRINMDDKAGLEKNLIALLSQVTRTVQKLTPGGAGETSPKSLSATGMAGVPLPVTPSVSAGFSSVPLSNPSGKA